MADVVATFWGLSYAAIAGEVDAAGEMLLFPCLAWVSAQTTSTMHPDAMYPLYV